jgi:3-oxoacyl-[acyl-carrier protein] reductase
VTSIEIPALPAPKVALVTGGSSGIGKATAARLAALGSTVIVGYNSRKEQAEAVVAGLQGSGHMALRVAVEDSVSISAAVKVVEDRFGRLDALVNSGGATTPVPIADLDKLTDEIFDRTVMVNLRGPFAMIRAFRPLLERGSGAAIVNISSIAARTGIGSSLAYLSAKAGVDALTIALAKVLAPRIRVFSVSPAGVDTDFVPGRSRETLVKTAEKLPLAHVTTPDDVARAAIACIVSLTSSTGIIVPVDEGRHL